MENLSKKRKRRKNPLKQAKKYAKIGWFGRGSSVSEDTYNYFLKIHEMKVENIEDEEEKAMIVSNALDQTKGVEVNLVMNMFISRVVESLLPFADDDVLERFIDAFVDLRILCTDNFASHVVQALVRVSSQRFRDKGRESFRNFVIKTSSFIFNNLEEFIYDSYANQIGRTCLKECSGSGFSSALSAETVSALAARILKWPKIDDLPDNALTSGFLQCLLESLSVGDPKLTKLLVKRFLNEYYLCTKAEDGDEKKHDGEDNINNLPAADIPEFFMNVPAARLLETAIEVSKGKTFTKIYLRIFWRRLKNLAVNRSSVMAVQKLISSCQDANEFNPMLEELISAFPDIIVAKHLKLLLLLAEGCTRLGTKEGDFLKGLKTGLNIDNNSGGDLVTKLIFTKNPYNVQKIDLNGSLLLQALLKFKKPISVVESFLALEPTTVKEIFTDPRGSHIADAFVQSKTIGEKSRSRLLHLLKGHYKELAVDKFGSRVIEALWSRASLKEKQGVMSELDRSISATMYGSIIASKLRLGTYLSNKTQWASTESAHPTKIFKELLE